MSAAYATVRQEIDRELEAARKSGLYKNELVITTPRGAHVGVDGHGELLNLCANYYLA